MQQMGHRQKTTYMKYIFMLQQQKIKLLSCNCWPELYSMWTLGTRKTLYDVSDFLKILLPILINKNDRTRPKEKKTWVKKRKKYAVLSLLAAAGRIHRINSLN
jgi:hypothetical protein